jgi:signal transduction histidine kinase
MRLLFRFTLVLFAALCVVMTAATYVGVRSRKLTFDQDMRRDHRQVGQILVHAMQRAWQTGGEAELSRLVEETTSQQQQISIHWIALDGRSGGAAPFDLPAAIRPRIANGETVSARIEHPGAGEFLHTFVPLAYDGTVRGVVELSESLDDERAFVRSSVVNAIGTTLSVAAVTASLAVLLGSFLVGRPMKLLMEKARRVGLGDLSGPLHLRTGDELAVLAGEMNLMCERLASARAALADESVRRLAALDQLRHADRLSTVGQLAAGVAHELGTPLNVISGRAGMIQSAAASGRPELVAEATQIIDEQVKRMTRIIRQLLDFARRRGPQRSPTDLVGLATRVAAMLAPMARRAGVEMSIHGPAAPSEVKASVDPSQIEQVLTNVVLNAIQAMPDGGILDVRIDRGGERPTSAPSAAIEQRVRIEVEDHGRGIDPGDLPHVFEPFFTTKDVGEGTGLGLSVSYGIVQDHGGQIELTSELGRGTRVSILLPEEGLS